MLRDSLKVIVHSKHNFVIDIRFYLDSFCFNSTINLLFFEQTGAELLWNALNDENEKRETSIWRFEVLEGRMGEVVSKDSTRSLQDIIAHAKFYYF